MEMTVVNGGRDHLGLGLGLGLSLGVAGTTSSVVAMAAPQCTPTGAAPTPGQKTRTASACHEMPLFLRGIDVNRVPAAGHEDEEPGASSPDSTLSTLSGKRGRSAAGAGGREEERACSDDDDSGSGAGGSHKKLRLSKDQSAVLEDSFNHHSTLNPKQKAALARQLGLRSRQVEVWFQNRRARKKLKQTEVDCEALRRRCDALTEENRRLQREVQALKLPLPPQLLRAPPLAMCPSCERVASSCKPPAVAENRAALGLARGGPALYGPCSWTGQPRGHN